MGNTKNVRQFGGTHMKGRTISARVPQTSPLPFFNQFKPATPAPTLPDGTKMEQYRHYPVRLLKDFPLGRTQKGKQAFVKVGSNHTAMRNMTNSVLLVKDEILCFKVGAVPGVDFEYVEEQYEELDASG